MALQLVASAKYLTGLPMALTATNTTPEADVFVSYDFKKDGVSVHKGATAAYTKAKAELSDAGSWTVTGIKEDDSEVESPAKVITIEKQKMTLGIVVTTPQNDIPVGASASVEAEVSGAPETAQLTFAWTLDGKPLAGEDGPTVYYDANKSGNFKFVATVTATEANFDTASKTSPEFTLVVKPRQMVDADLAISPATQSVSVGDQYTLEADITGVDGIDQLEMTFLWDTGETTPTITRTAADEGTLSPTLEVTLRAVDYENKTLNASATVTVTKAEESGCIKYIHPLDHRESAYIWAGWWVMREIEYATDKGIDWKKPDGTDLKYKCDLKTLAKMLTDYPNVEVQESRNGYILDRETLEVGIIY